MNLQFKVLREGFRILNTVSPKTSARLAERLFLSVEKPTLLEEHHDFLSTAKMERVPFADNHLITYQWGESTQPTVLLAHGWSSSAVAYKELIIQLRTSGYRVIAYDMLSHGLSPKQRLPITSWADALHAMLGYFGEVDTVIGHSLGAAGIIIGSKLELPTKKIVLISPVADIVDISDRFAQMLNISEQAIKMKRDNIWSKYDYSANRYGKNWHDIFNSTFRVPTLIVHDRNDRKILVDNAERMAKRWDWAQTLFTENLGHSAILRDTNTLQQVVGFVQKGFKPELVKPPVLQAEALKPRWTTMHALPAKAAIAVQPPLIVEPRPEWASLH